MGLISMYITPPLSSTCYIGELNLLGHRLVAEALPTPIPKSIPMVLRAEDGTSEEGEMLCEGAVGGGETRAVGWSPLKN